MTAFPYHQIGEGGFYRNFLYLEGVINKYWLYLQDN